jgi:Fe-S cluster biogenesis protein NfuA
MSRPSRQLPIVDPVATPTLSPGAAAGTPGGGAAGGAAVPVEAAPRELWDRVKAILDLIRPAVQEDGGDVELVEVGTDGLVKVRFHGACVGCPSSSITLQTGIERNLRDHVREVTSVIAVP